MNKKFLIAFLSVVFLLQPYFAMPANGCLPAYSWAVLAEDEKYYRTELYFGRSIPGGGMVSDEEWAQFLAEVVTPKFPDGFTVLKGQGQYRESTGKIISEPSQILIFLYAAKMRKTSRAKIDEIRAAYIKRFNQESVLRLDFPKTVEVSF
jgi:Protein of unknown function (DUF3574)